MKTLQINVFATAALLAALLIQISSAGAFDAQGHRGARGLAPENTLPAFARALSIGVDTLELDVGVTRDGILVVSHNPWLNPDITRDSHGKWLQKRGPAIHSLTLKQLKTYDVGRLKPGTRYQRKFRQQRPVAGTQMPTLVAVLNLVKRSRNSRVRLNIETKLRPLSPKLTLNPRDFATLLLKVIRDHGFIRRVTIQSFDWRTLREVQRQAPQVPTSYLSAQQRWLDNIQRGKAGPSPWTAGFDVDKFNGDVPAMIKAAGGKIWSPYHRPITAQKIRHAHELGLKVKVWTVDKPKRMKALIGMGVDGIITDYPDRLRKVLKKLGMPRPAPTPVPR